MILQGVSKIAHFEQTLGKKNILEYCNLMKVLKICIVLLSILTCIGLSDAVEAKMLSTTVSNVNIRSGPGTKYDILWQAGKHCPLKILKKQGEWYRFKDFEEDTGWIHKSLVAFVPSMVVKMDDINVRSGPGKKHPVIFKATKGVSFKALRKKGDWVQVEHEDGDTGWAYRRLLWGYTK